MNQLPNFVLITISLCLNEVVRAQQNSSSDTTTAAHQTVYHPSVAVIVGMLSVMISVVFLILAYAKFCHRSSYVHGSAQRRGDGPWGGTRINSSARFSGIDRRAIELLPIFRFESVQGSKEGLECAVCINRFEDSEMLRLLPKCKHAFHASCIDKWLESHSTCPLCRYRLDPKDVASSRFSTSMQNPFEVIGVGIFVEREEDSDRRNCGNDASLLRDERGGEMPSFHKFRHRIIVPELIDRSRWSDVNSSDLVFLRSEMISSVSSGTLPSDRDHIVKIKEDIKRKRLFESIKPVDRTDNVNGPSSSLYEENPYAVANVRTKKRCMSEISGVPRFALKIKSKGFAMDNDGTRSVWPPIMQRTLQWFGPDEKQHNLDNFVCYHS